MFIFTFVFKKKLLIAQARPSSSTAVCSTESVSLPRNVFTSTLTLDLNSRNTNNSCIVLTSAMLLQTKQTDCQSFAVLLLCVRNCDVFFGLIGSQNSTFHIAGNDRFEICSFYLKFHRACANMGSAQAPNCVFITKIQIYKCAVLLILIGLLPERHVGWSLRRGWGVEWEVEGGRASG